MHFPAFVPALMATSLAFAGLSSTHPAELSDLVPSHTHTHTAPASGGTTSPVAQAAPAPALPAYQTKTDDSPYQLAEFDVLWWDLWVPPLSIDTWGKYTTCYNLPMPWANSVGSVGMNKTQAPSCWTYKAKDCAGDYKVVGKEGIPIYEGGVASFICDSPK